ncbi:hypothetical protein HDU92_005597 [Lobulomyces angularis]|nr:hypothetical protein HDU92_005597 [Lobulomyces angularis]
MSLTAGEECRLAASAFNSFTDPNKSQSIPPSLVASALGVAIVRGTNGTAVVRTASGEWSAPCAFALYSSQTDISSQQETIILFMSEQSIIALVKNSKVILNQTHSFLPGPLTQFSQIDPADMLVYVRYNGNFTAPELIMSGMSGWEIGEDSNRHKKWHGSGVTWFDVLTNKITVDRSSVGNALYLVLNLVAGRAPNKGTKKNFVSADKFVGPKPSDVAISSGVNNQNNNFSNQLQTQEHQHSQNSNVKEQQQFQPYQNQIVHQIEQNAQNSNLQKLFQMNTLNNSNMVNNQQQLLQQQLQLQQQMGNQQNQGMYSGYNNYQMQSGGFDNNQTQGGYNQIPAQSGYNQSQMQGVYNQIPMQHAFNQNQMQSGFNQNQVQGGGMNQNQMQSGFNPNQMQGNYNQNQMQGSYNQNQMQGGFNNSAAMHGNQMDGNVMTSLPIDNSNQMYNQNNQNVTSQMNVGSYMGINNQNQQFNNNYMPTTMQQQQQNMGSNVQSPRNPYLPMNQQ